MISECFGLFQAKAGLHSCIRTYIEKMLENLAKLIKCRFLGAHSRVFRKVQGLLGESPRDNTHAHTIYVMHNVSRMRPPSGFLWLMVYCTYLMTQPITLLHSVNENQGFINISVPRVCRLWYALC